MDIKSNIYKVKSNCKTHKKITDKEFTEGVDHPFSPFIIDTYHYTSQTVRA
jgi:hypothetical protein